jgi:hypothetical protein
VRIALLEPPGPQLERVLAAAGHEVAVLGPTRAGALLEAALRLRKLGEGLGHAVPAALAVGRGRFDVAHAFCPAAALAAGGARAAVLTFATPVTRERLADRRLRIATLERALAGSTVVAPDAEVQASLRRWLGVEARVLDPADGPGHAALYAELLECRPA